MAYRQRGVAAVVADETQHALGGEGQAAVLVEACGCVIHSYQVLEQVRARRIGRPLHGLPQNVAAIEREILHDFLRRGKTARDPLNSL